jgi:hypothetical protein
MSEQITLKHAFLCHCGATFGALDELVEHAVTHAVIVHKGRPYFGPLYIPPPAPKPATRFVLGVFMFGFALGSSVIGVILAAHLADVFSR